MDNQEQNKIENKEQNKILSLGTLHFRFLMLFLSSPLFFIVTSILYLEGFKLTGQILWGIYLLFGIFYINLNIQYYRKQLKQIFKNIEEQLQNNKNEN